jgi:hypothetical protein
LSNQEEKIVAELTKCENHRPSFMCVRVYWIIDILILKINDILNVRVRVQFSSTVRIRIVYIRSRRRWSKRTYATSAYTYTCTLHGPTVIVVVVTWTFCRRNHKVVSRPNTFESRRGRSLDVYKWTWDDIGILVHRTWTWVCVFVCVCACVSVRVQYFSRPEMDH